MIAAATRAALKTIQEEKLLENKEVDSEESVDGDDSDSESEDELVMDTAPPPPPANQPPSRPTRIQADQAAYSALGESNRAKIVQNLIFKKL